MLPYSLRRFWKCHWQQTSHYFEKFSSRCLRNSSRLLCRFDGYISLRPVDSDFAEARSTWADDMALFRGRERVPSDDGITSSLSLPLLFEPYTLDVMMKLCRSGMLRVPRRSADSDAFGLSTVCLNQPTSWPQMY